MKQNKEKKMKHNKQFKTYIYLVVLILLPKISSIAQPVDDKRVINTINKDVISFLTKIGDLEEGYNLEENINRITIVEIINKQPLGYDKSGIFLFRSLSGPNYTYILLKNNSKFRILDLHETAKSFQHINKFLQELDISNEDIVKYNEEVIKIFKYNCYKCNKM
jgi:hypothetical protein